MAEEKLTPVPVREIFDKKEIKRLEFEKWRADKDNRTPTEEGKAEWKNFRRRELMAKLGRK